MALSIVVSSISFPDLANLGTEINFLVDVRNDGDQDITSVTLANNITTFTPDLISGFNSGDENQDNLLNPGETWFYSADYTVTQQDLDNNGAVDGKADGAIVSQTTVTATGSGGGTTSALSTDSAALEEFRPSIALSQTPTPSPAGAGTTVTFAIQATNNGNCGFSSLDLTGSLAKPVQPENQGGFNTGDLDKDGAFDIGETWNFKATYTVTQADITNQGAGDGTADGALTNTVTAQASLLGETGSTPYTTSNSTKVDLITGPPPCQPKPCHPCRPRPCHPKPPVCKPPSKPCFLFGGWKPLHGQASSQAASSSGWNGGAASWNRGGLLQSGRWDWWSGMNVVSSPFQRGFGGWFR